MAALVQDVFFVSQQRFVLLGDDMTELLHFQQHSDVRFELFMQIRDKRKN